jgi:8-oxo-dGTP pyrophosphatase MutT (NUDIX family)
MSERENTGAAGEAIVTRDAARAILLTPGREVLLLRIRPPDERRPFWITPGGGLKEGEDLELGLRRELEEELGLVRFDVGPLVWRRQHTFTWAGKRLCQRERFFVVHIDRFDPQMLDAMEMQIVDRCRWWSVSEMATTREPIVPVSLAEIVQRYLLDGPPSGPLGVEVLVD